METTRRTGMTRCLTLAGALAFGLTVFPAIWSAAAAQTAVVRVMTTETNPDTKAALDSIAADYQKQNPAVKIELQYVGFQDLNQKLMSALAAGDPPQIFNVQNHYELFELANKGIIRPVDDVIDRI